MVESARKGVGIRVGLEGDEVVRRGFDQMADSGKKMFAELATGARTAHPAITGLNQASVGAQDAAGGMAGNLGLAGRAAGLMSVAAIGATAVLAAMTAAVLQARDAMEFANELQGTAKALGVTTDALQEYQFVLRKAGKDEEDAARALENFRQKFGAARAELTKGAVKPFEALGLGAEDLKRFPSWEDALNDVTQRISELSDEAEQAAIAEKLGLTEMLPALQMGAGAIADLRQEAHSLGVVMDAELIERAANAQEEFETVSKVIRIQLMSAFVDLAPVITATMGLVADLARAFSDMADSWRDLDSKSQRGLERELSKARVEREKLGLEDLMAGAPRMPNEQFIQTYRRRDMGDLDVRIADLERRIGEREAARPSGEGSRSLIPPPGRPPRAARGPKGLSAEEKAEGLEALQLEHDLSLARATGNEELERRLELARLIASESEKLVRFGVGEAEALRMATEYAERLAIAREIAAEKKRQDAAFQRSIVDVGSSPTLSEGLPALVMGPNGTAWSPEQQQAWARSVGDATVDGLDYALRGGDIGEYLKQMFYRNILEGTSNAIANALAQADFSSFNAQSGGEGWFGQALNWAGQTFFGSSGQTTGRAAGGPMGQGYHFGEHGRPELGMFSNGYVADHEATMRMLTEAMAMAGQASGGRGGERTVHLHLSSPLTLPAGYLPDAGLKQVLAEHRQQTVAMVASQVGPLASVQMEQDYQLKG